MGFLYNKHLLCKDSHNEKKFFEDKILMLKSVYNSIFIVNFAVALEVRSLQI